MAPRQLSLSGVNHEDVAARVARVAFAAILKARDGNPGFRLTEAALTDALRPALAKELPKQARVNGANPLFDALAEACGIVAPYTKSAAGQVAKALKEIREVDPQVTPEKLARVTRAIRRKYENAGPMAVSTHWHEWAQRDRGETKSAVEAPPAGWLATLNRLFPDSTLAKGGRFEIPKETDYQWERLDAEIRGQIRKAST